MASSDKDSEGINTKIFQISLGTTDYPMNVKVPMTIPITDDSTELAHRIIQHHNLPIFVFEELSDALEKFILSVACEVDKMKAEQQIQKIRNDSQYFNSILDYWDKLEQDPQVCPELLAEEELPSLYHNLVHSASGSKLLQLEHQYSREVAMLVDKRESCIKKLEEKQASELSEAVSSNLSDSEVNAVTARHLEASELTCAEWDSAISGLKEQQLRNFRAMLRDGQVAGAAEAVAGQGTVPVPVLEESFTIHLGTQMKQMHNLRLIASDPLDLCQYGGAEPGIDELPPQRIQTSLQLYGKNLHGLVLMVDNRITSYSGIRKDFGVVCSRATELHFPELCDQLETIREQLLPSVATWRQNRQEQNNRTDCPTQLMPGDVYITRHSNLSEVHVVFHVVCEDVNSVTNSRHPVILGIRNVLKVACLCDITTLSLPLLLSHSLSEDMSVSWCQRRAELVYKCVKGFMMEMASWGGSEMNTLQFMLPKNISEMQFHSLSAMLPSIFRVSNPLVV